MAHRRGNFAKKIDSVHWTYGTASSLGQTSGSIVAVSVLAAQHLPETLMRIRGEWFATIDGVQNPGVSCSVTIGAIQVPEGTGTTVLWSPAVDGDAPWIWWDVMALSYEEAVVNATQYGGGAGRRVIDSKAMRKMRNTELQVVIENLNIQSSPVINVQYAARHLAGS